MAAPQEDNQCAELGNTGTGENRTGQRGWRSKLTNNSKDHDMICELTGHKQGKDLTESENCDGFVGEQIN